MDLAVRGPQPVPAAGLQSVECLQMPLEAVFPAIPGFDLATRRVLANARDEAVRLRNNYIGPEHVFMALLREETALAARVLRGHAFDSGRLSALLEVRRGTSEESDLPALLPRTQKALELAAAAAAEFDSIVNPELLLLGLLREVELDGAIVDLFRFFGADRERIRRATVAAIETKRRQPPPA